VVRPAEWRLLIPDFKIIGTLLTKGTPMALQMTVISFAAVTMPAGARLAPHGFYLLGLSTSGLTAAAAAGDTIIHVRSVTGLSTGDALTIGTGSAAETRRIASLGTPSEAATTLWQPEPDGRITLAAGATNVPVASTAGFILAEIVFT